jgi:hypothetical protein
VVEVNRLIRSGCGACGGDGHKYRQRLEREESGSNRRIIRYLSLCWAHLSDSGLTMKSKSVGCCHVVLASGFGRQSQTLNFVFGSTEGPDRPRSDVLLAALCPLQLLLHTYCTLHGCSSHRSMFACQIRRSVLFFSRKKSASSTFS